MRVGNNWNDLSRKMMDFLSSEVFKSRLDVLLKYMVLLQQKLQTLYRNCYMSETLGQFKLDHCMK